MLGDIDQCEIRYKGRQLTKLLNLKADVLRLIVEKNRGNQFKLRRGANKQVPTFATVN